MIESFSNQIAAAWQGARDVMVSVTGWFYGRRVDVQDAHGQQLNPSQAGGHARITGQPGRQRAYTQYLQAQERQLAELSNLHRAEDIIAFLKQQDSVSVKFAANSLEKNIPWCDETAMQFMWLLKAKCSSFNQLASHPVLAKVPACVYQNYMQLALHIANPSAAVVRDLLITFADDEERLESLFQYIEMNANGIEKDFAVELIKAYVDLDCDSNLPLMELLKARCPDFHAITNEDLKDLPEGIRKAYNTVL